MAHSNWSWIDAVNPTARSAPLYRHRFDKLGWCWNRRNASPGFVQHLIGVVDETLGNVPDQPREHGLIWDKVQSIMVEATGLDVAPTQLKREYKLIWDAKQGLHRKVLA